MNRQDYLQRRLGDNYYLLAPIVGPRPSPHWILMACDYALSMNTRYRAPITKDNFVWVRKNSLEDARQGMVSPPRHPRWTPEQQTTNDLRFHQLVKGTVTRAIRKQARDQEQDRLREQYTQLLAKITEYTISKGYEARDALNPEILPKDSHPRLAAAREALNGLLARITDPHHEAKRRQLDELRLKTQRKRKDGGYRKQSPDEAAHTGRPGRPVQRWIYQRVPIASMTPEQKQSQGIPLDATFIKLPCPANPAKTRTIRHLRLVVENPKYHQQVQTIVYQTQTQAA